jgi:hypothetical protein
LMSLAEAARRKSKAKLQIVRGTYKARE